MIDFALTPQQTALKERTETLITLSTAKETWSISL